jgi:DNA-binding SARP family transcriptional activator
MSSAYWALGEVETCASHALRAFTAAQRCGDDRALAAGHTALAMRAMIIGDRVANSTHYAKALGFAEAAKDSVQVIRVRMNRASHFMYEACVDEALEDLTVAVAEAERLGNAVLLAVSLTNEGDALSTIGRLDVAAERLRRAIQICQRAGSTKICFPLQSLGEVYRRRAQPALARAAYEEVIPLAEKHGHLQVLIPALAGLAMVLADSDSAAALAVAKRARAEAVGPFITVALLAMARATLAEGDRERAAELAEEAQCSARAHRDRIGVARALELQAESCDEWARAGRYLTEARSIWRDIGAAYDADRVTVALGRLPMVLTEAYTDATLAAQRLSAAGLSTGSPAAATTIRTLGRFEVLVAGKPMPPSAWQSRKARDLLRLLVSRRGRPAMREELIELLWADERGSGPDKRAHRLAVALSIVRGMLDGTKQSCTDSVVLADGSSVALDVTRTVIDLETFMRQAEHGLRLCRDGHPAEGRAILASAERLYTGDFLEDEPYDDWSAMPREQARATYLRVGRSLADCARDLGQTDEAIHYLLRILAMDAYDEQSHRYLIDSYFQAGRHGEARRARDRYTAAMREIGV